MKNKKYKLLKKDTIKVGNTILYRIQSLKDFKGVRKGELGGYVEREDNLSHDGLCWVYDNARIYNNAWVYGNAQVYGNAEVYDNAEVYGNARVYGDAWVYNNTEVYGNARVYGNTEVYGNARLKGNYKYKQGWFIGGDDTGKITDITDKTGTDYWKCQYVLGDYEIKPIQKKQEGQESSLIEIDGKKFSKETIKEALRRYVGE